MTHEFDNNSPRAPVDQLHDERIPQRSMLEFPDDSYYTLVNMVRDRITAASGGLTPALRTDIVHHLALRDMLAWKLFSPQAAEREAALQARATPGYDAALKAHQASFAHLQTHGGQLSPTDILGYLMGKLESHTTFLATGQEPTDWPEATARDGLLHIDTITAVRATAELVHLGIDIFANELGDVAPAMAARHQAWLAHTCSVLLSRGLVALAAPLINTARGGGDGGALVDELSVAMATLRATDQDEYRTSYRFIAQTLQAPLNDRFVARNERVGAPLTPGAQREDMYHGNTRVLVERYETNQPVSATVADGTEVELPYTEFVLRALVDYETPDEHETLNAQPTVYYADLDDAAKLAIDEARRAALLDRLREETLPHYRRLVLKSGGPAGDTLHTLDFRDGFMRLINRYPDDHGWVTSNSEPQIDAAVASATPVMDGYLVLATAGDSISEIRYRDAEPNFFGPGEDRANAFWIAGSPRLVIDQEGRPEYMQEGTREGFNDLARWVIMPIRYYRVQTDTPQHDYDAPF